MRLKEKEIDIIYKYKSGTHDIQGISFSKEGKQLKGSQIDRSLSYGNIAKQLILNSQQETLADAFKRTARESSERTSSVNEYSAQEQDDNIPSESKEHFGISLIEEFMNGFGGGGDVDDDAYKRKQRNNNQNDSHMSR